MPKRDRQQKATQRQRQRERMQPPDDEATAPSSRPESGRRIRQSRQWLGGRVDAAKREKLEKKLAEMRAGWSYAKEKWRPVVRWERDYEVSNMGRIRRISPGGSRTYVGRILKSSIDSWGYIVAGLPIRKKDGRLIAPLLKVHRLVLETFVGPCPEGMEARHLNGNTLDARLSNLRWGTPLENAADMLAHGRRAYGDKHPHAKLNAELVCQLRTGLVSPESVMASTGVSRTSVRDALMRRTWKRAEGKELT